MSIRKTSHVWAWLSIWSKSGWPLYSRAIVDGAWTLYALSGSGDGVITVSPVEYI